MSESTAENNSSVDDQTDLEERTESASFPSDLGSSNDNTNTAESSERIQTDNAAQNDTDDDVDKECLDEEMDEVTREEEDENKKNNLELGQNAKNDKDDDVDKDCLDEEMDEVAGEEEDENKKNNLELGEDSASETAGERDEVPIEMEVDDDKDEETKENDDEKPDEDADDKSEKSHEDDIVSTQQSTEKEDDNESPSKSSDKSIESQGNDEALDVSTGESEFGKFLTQAPEGLDSTIEGEAGIMIHDSEIIKPEDVFGRGKRSRTPKTDSIYATDFEQDPDYDPSVDRRREQPRKQVVKVPKAVVQQLTNGSSGSPKKEGTPGKRPRHPHLDIKALELPALTGWKREIVVRNTFDEMKEKRRPADVYYKPPVGKKLRSMIDVKNHLTKYKITDLTEANFTFLKTSISNPPFETVRQAGKSKAFTPSRNKPEIMIEKDSDEPAIPFNNNSASPSKVIKSPRGRKRKLSVGRGRPSLNKSISKEDKPGGDGDGKENIMLSLPPDMQLKIKTEPVDPDDENEKEKQKEAEFPECPPTLEETRASPALASPALSPPRKKSKTTARKSTTQKSFKPGSIVTSPEGKLESLCTLHCPGLANIPPTLQCSICLCMFHPKCVNMSPMAASFICLRCISSCTSKTMPSSPKIVKLNANLPSETLLSNAKTVTSTPPGHPGSKPTLVSLNTFIANASKAPNNSSMTLVSSISGKDQVKNEPTDYRSADSPGIKASNAVIGNVREFLERKADINQNQNLGQKFPPFSVIKENLNKPFSRSPKMFVPPKSTTTTYQYVAPPVIMTALPNIRPIGSLQGTNLVTSNNVPQMTLMPPRLTAAPVAKPATPILPAADTPDNKQGQLLTLPPIVIKRLNLTQPVSLKINNTQVTVPPSSFLHTAQGLKLFLPKNTFPVNTGETAKLSVTVTNDKTLSLDTGESKCETPTQLPKIVPNSSRSLVQEFKKTKRQPDIKVANCFIKCLYGGFDCMMEVFRYLNVRDLFNAASVCKSWRKLVMHPCLWKEVKFRNMRVIDWEKAATYLSRRAVEILDLRGLQHHEDRNKTWHQLISNIHMFPCVNTVYFGTVPASVLQTLCEKMPQLEVLSAEWISDVSNEEQNKTPAKLDIGKFSSLTKLRELKLRGTSGLTMPAFSFSGGLNELKSLTQLQKLSLTSLKELGSDTELEFLTSLPNLTHLEIGDCVSWTNETYSIIGKLTQLKSLRLECSGNSYDMGLAECLANLTQLENLELIQFLIAENLHETLEKLERLKSLTVWPDTSSQPAAQVNSFTLYTVTQLKSLKTLEWGILTNKDSSLILDGEESSRHDKENSQEWIPFMPASHNDLDGNGESHTEYISVVNFKDRLAKLLPNTHLSVFSKESVSRMEDDS